MASATEDSGFNFEISLSVLNHLGRNLYRNFITVLGEAISNSWDADATDVQIDIDRPGGKFVIKDDGNGMSAGDFQAKFLRIGYSKRKEGVTETDSGRPYIGAKGIGKLALLSCARRISIFTKTVGGEYVGGVIDNGGLDAAIKDDLKPDAYPLEKLDLSLIEGLTDGHESGTIIVFEGANEILTHTSEHIRKLLALSFRFSVFDPDFNIIVDGTEVSIGDLQGLSDATEFIWNVNAYNDDFTDGLSKLEADPIQVTTELPIEGFIATVRKPRDLKIAGTEERATVDLFANGRLRERNVIRHIPTQRLAESYMYGQIHYNVLDQKGDDPFTSSREGIVESDPDFQKLLDYLKSALLKQIIEDDWDQLRWDRGKEGDDENTRVPKKDRKAASLFAVTVEEFKPETNAPEAKVVTKWLNGLRPDAVFNLAAYSDCYLAENLVRKFIREHGVALVPDALTEAATRRSQEAVSKAKANVSFDVRQDNDDVCYLGMNFLAETAEGSKPNKQQQSLWNDAINYKPARDAVGHTALLTPNAKAHLNLAFQNIRGRVKALLQGLAGSQ